MRIASLVVLLLGLLSAPLLGADWPGWRGPDGTGVSKETGLLKTWAKEGAKLAWKTSEAGKGLAGMAVVKGQIYTMGARDKDEYLLVLDDKGKVAWSHKIGPVHIFEGNSWSYGPNSTPLVVGEHVYALGSQGTLICATKDKIVWKKDIPKDMDGEVINKLGGPKGFGWGYSWSPMLDGETLVITPGGPKGLFAGLDRKTGTVLWRGKSAPDPATYSTGAAGVIAGVRQYVYIVQDGVVGVKAADGELLWRYKRADGEYPDVVCPTPIIDGDRVIAPVGYGAGKCVCLKISRNDKGFQADIAWGEKNEIGNKQSGVVLFGKHLYGFHDTRAWVCQEAASGEVVWKSPQRNWPVAGGLVIADGRIYTADEKNKVAMIEASPNAPPKLISQFEIKERSANRPPDGNKIWTHPSLSDGKLYIRDQELIFCYEVK